MDSTPPILALETRLRGPLRPLFSDPRPVFLRSAPGRVDVLGGMAAEAGGTLAQMALPHRAAVAAQLRSDPQLLLHTDDIHPPLGEPAFAISLENFFSSGNLIPPHQVAAHLDGPHAWATPLVALWYVLQQGARGQRLDAPVTGVTLAIRSTIAMNAGQASSTAVVAAALAALADAYGLQIEPLEAALYVHRAENLFTSASAHVVDAMTCLQALDAAPQNRPHLLRYSAQPHQLVGQITLPPEVRILALDTGVRYTSATATLQSLRLAGAMGLRIIDTVYKDLGQRHTPLRGYLANLSPSLYRQYFRSLLPRRMRGHDFVRTYGPLPERAGTIQPAKIYRVRTAVDHLITEHEHAENFLQAMEELTDVASLDPLTPTERERTLRRAGRLMLASHHSYRLRLELSCREADWLVDSLMASGPDQGLYGARISSCGGGGTVVALLNRSPNATDALLRTLSAYSQMTGLHLIITEPGTPGSAGAYHTQPHPITLS